MRDGPITIGMKPPHPGDFIRTEIPEELGLSITRAAGILGGRRAILSDLVNGKASLSPAMALRVEETFGVSMKALLRMQVASDRAQARSAAGRSCDLDSDGHQ
jgi:addiction module HigA family antidote